MQLIQYGGDYLLTLINQVLDLSKIEAGRLEVELTDFNLPYLLATLQAMFALKAQAKGLTLRLEQSAQLPTMIRSDELKLRQIIINLLNNALKFTHKGSIVLRVTHQAVAKGYQLRFEVEDSGVGIAASDLEQLFQAFSQTESGRQSHEGTGLGLVISQRLVQTLGGYIEVQSQEGYGTVFRFQVLVGQALAQPARLMPRWGGLAANQPTYKILLVDDRAENRLLLRQLLEPLGFVLQEAANGQEAMVIWQTWQPDLIYLDLRMPHMSGYEVAQRIRALEQTTEKPPIIIAISASALVHEQELALRQGCNDFLHKPFREIDIWMSLQRHLGVQFVTIDSSDEPHAAELPATVIAPPAAELAKLHKLLNMGKIDQLQHQARALKALDERYAPFADKLWALAEQLDEENLLILLTQGVPEEGVVA